MQPNKPQIKTIPSLLKWTGSKRSQALEIYSYFPEHKRYIEPFLGGGALLFVAANNNALAGDIYRPLVDFWNLVQADVDTLISNYKEQWEALQDDLPGYFYITRDRFNNNPNPLDLNFLMRTCVNGIVRFNSNGEFNNSFHLSRKGMQPHRFEKIAREWNKVIQGVDFICQDYRETIKSAEKGDLVYFDPPYAGNNMRYIENLNLDAFFKSLEDLNSKGIYWALSFDGMRGDKNLLHPVPKELYKRQLLLSNGHSFVNNVLNNKCEEVKESLYLNF